MKYDPDRHHRRSLRLKGFNYTKAGWYFLTIVAQHREMLFGEVVNHIMILNDAGKMVNSIWQEIPKYYQGIRTDAFQIMPNHLHGIINITEINPSGLSLGTVVQRFKSLTTKCYIDGVKEQQWKPFSRRIWQRNYWERIIRNEAELNRIRKYITNNPLKW